MTPAPPAGRAAGEPPVLLDPRRSGALIGLAGALVFIISYAPVLGARLALVLSVVGVGLAVVVLALHYVRPRPLGAFRGPRRSAVAIYLGCVAGELVVIAAGSRLLVHLGRAELRPALIAAVVGLHFLPFAWAFGEPLFYRLGAALLVLGSLGLVAGAAGVVHAAEAAAVLSGLVMLVLLLLQARGRSARRPG